MYRDLHVRRASTEDLAIFEELLKAHAEEIGELERYDAPHARRHLTALLQHDLSYLAYKDGKPIGCSMCEPIDIAIRVLPDFQTAHVFVEKAHRDLAAINALFDAMEALADSRGASLVLFHLDYLAAVNGLETNGRRYEKLMRRRGYQGPITQCLARQPYVHVGVAYLYQGPSVKPGDPIDLPDVRLIPRKLTLQAAPSGEWEQAGPDGLYEKPEAAE